MKQKKKNLREKVNEKNVRLLEIHGRVTLDRVFFVLVCKKKKKTTENNAYRITIHLEDKRKEFENCYKLTYDIRNHQESGMKTKKHKIHLYTTKS